MSLDSFKAQVENDMDRRFKAAGFFLQSKIREELNTAQEYKRYGGSHGVYFKGLDPSKPGNFPHKLSGQLLKSISFIVQKDSLIVGSNLDGYPAILQKGSKTMAARPWLSLAWANYQDEVMKILTK